MSFFSGIADFIGVVIGILSVLWLGLLVLGNLGTTIGVLVVLCLGLSVIGKIIEWCKDLKQSATETTTIPLFY